MFQTVRIINEKTSVVTDGQTEFIAKKILPEDIDIYEKLARVSPETPNIARIRGVFPVDDSLCAVRDYIDGVTLEEYIEKYGPADEKRTKLIAGDICKGLAAVHALGIVHRDINPSNIIIDPIGKAVIIDFAISRTVKKNQPSDTQILGTQGYAAPEQFGFNQTDPRTDIYALGVLVNYMLTGHLPNEKPAFGHLGNVVRKCIKPDPSDRYRSVREVAFALNHPVLGVSIFCYIPGFRSGKPLHIIAAVLYYLSLLFFLMVCSVGKDVKLNPWQFLFFVFDLVAPVLILTDFLDWSKRIKLTAFMSRGKLLALKILLSVICALPMIVLLVVSSIKA